MAEEIQYTNVEKLMLKYGENIKQEFITQLDSKKPGNSVTKTVDYEVTVAGTKYSLVFFIEDYYKFIESGRKPNSKMPPIPVISKWINLKKIIPKKRNGIIPTTKQLAFLIAKSIGKKGIKALPILSKTIKKYQKDFLSQLEEAFKSDIENSLKQDNLLTDKKT